jgi:hypothetical protein
VRVKLGGASIIRRKAARAMTVLSLLVIGGLALGTQEARSAGSINHFRLPDHQVVIHKMSKGVTRTLRHQWTRARMRAAVPAPLPPNDGQKVGALEIPVAGEVGVPRLIGPSQAGTRGRATGRIPLASVSGDIPFSRFEVTDTVSPPARTHGTVYYSDSSGDYACSGTAISSPTESVVFTAGHCVFDQAGGWAQELIFVPAYRNGTAPYGVFPARTLSALTSWTVNENSNYDYGGVLVGPNSSGTSLQQAVGARGIAFNQPREQSFQAWGYPGEGSFDGERSYVCESAYGGDDPFPSPGPPAMGIGCDMTRGASGGGWVIGGEYVNSVTSFSYPSYPDVLFGPYFGEGAKTVYDSICCDPADRPPGTTNPPPTPERPQPPPVPDAAKPSPTTQRPNTFIRWHPPRRTVHRRAVFRFRSSLAGSSFKCLYGAGWRRCNSPKIFRHLAPGSYVFKVRAIKGGLQDPTPAVWRFRVLRRR